MRGSLLINPDTLYSLDELRQELDGIVELATLLDRLGLRERRVFKGALWGWEILDAARRARSYAEPETAGRGAMEPALCGGETTNRGQAAPSGGLRRLKPSDLRQGQNNE